MSHLCPGGCGRRNVSQVRLACRYCWPWLPRDIRWRLTTSWGNSPGQHNKALAEALRWFEVNLAGHPIPLIELVTSMTWHYRTVTPTPRGTQCPRTPQMNR